MMRKNLLYRGYFGILPVAFCSNCYSSIMDMAEQDSPMIEEVGGSKRGMKAARSERVGIIDLVRV